MSSTSTCDILTNDQRRHVVRWLLRPLAEPAFLRFYVEKDFDTTLPVALFESAFWALEPNPEHPDDDRKYAWNIMKAWLPSTVQKGSEWFRILLQKLGSRETTLEGRAIFDDVQDLSKHWVLPELFNKPAMSTFELSNYYELHCHLRGAVPFTHMWNDFLYNERVRANLRKEKCSAGDWSKTWAELCAIAATCAPNTESHAETFFWEMSKRVQQSPEPCDHEIRYLAICAGLRRYLLHQRGEVGLSSFVISYDRYSKVQKPRGAGDGFATRKAVCAILDQFRKHGCVAVELRPTLETRAEDLHKKLRDVILGYFDHVRSSTDQPLAMGLVPSLFKQELIKKHDSDGESHPQIWEEQAKRWKHQVDLLLNAVDKSPALRQFVVGIDAAGKEMGCPPRVLGRAFSRVRERTAQYGLARVRAGRVMSVDWMKRLVAGAGDDYAKQAWESLEGAYVPHARLGLTVHAGEDFADPLTGLRHIWESVYALDLWEGDRIGHAIAASLDKQSLAHLLERRSEETPGAAVEKRKQHGEDYFRIRKPRGTHLLDLAWAYDVAETASERHTTGTMLMQAMGETSRHAMDVERSVRMLQQEHETVWPFFPGVRYFDPKQIQPEHWTWVCLDAETLVWFQNLRDRVVRMLVRRGIVVESCPTSNLAVANLREPPIHSLLELPGLRCIVATDDPGLFDAWPKDEFTRTKATEQQKRRLLEEGARSSFVRLA